MAKWMYKAALQKAISLMPDGHKINYFFQKHVTKMRLDDAMMEQALVHCSDHVRHERAAGTDVGDFTTLELGTGWYAVVPIGFFLSGFRAITTVDITPLLRPENLAIAVTKLCEYHERGRLERFLPDIPVEKLRALSMLATNVDEMTVDEILNVLGIRYVVGDARQLGLPRGSVDFIHSNDVFEHIDPTVLVDILREFKRVGRRGGVMSHFVDMSDHFSHFDKSIGPYNFLRYSDVQWKLIDNSVAPQSRLRLPEYRQLYRRAGVAITEEKPHRGDTAALGAMRLSRRFNEMPLADVAVTHAYLMSTL